MGQSASLQSWYCSPQYGQSFLVAVPHPQVFEQAPHPPGDAKYTHLCWSYGSHFVDNIRILKVFCNVSSIFTLLFSAKIDLALFQNRVSSLDCGNFPLTFRLKLVFFISRINTDAMLGAEQRWEAIQWGPCFNIEWNIVEKNNECV